MRHVIAILSAIVLSLVSTAQQPALNFLNFSSQNGLSSNTVNAVTKDRLGYMWFATEDGLNRYNGIGFTVYNHNVSDSNSLATNQIQTIYEDPNGNLWVGTNRSLSLYDRKRDCFQNFDITNGTGVRSIVSDDAGHLWVASYAGLILFDPVTKHAKYYTKDAAGPGKLLSNTITCVFRDSRRRLWAGSNTGLYLYQPATDNFKRFSNSPADSGSISDDVIKTISEDGQGHLWFGTSNGGLNWLEADGCHFKHLRYKKTDLHSLSSDRVYCIVPEGQGILWIGTEDGLNIFDTRTGRVEQVTANERNKYGLKGRSVRSIFIDRSGIYWVCTYQGGINKYDRNLAFFNLVQYNSFDTRGLSSPKVTSFSECDNGDIYVGTDGGGLNLFHRKTGLIDHIALGDSRHTAGLAILALERWGQELWIGTYQHGVYVLDTRSMAIKHFVQGSGERELPSDEIFCITHDRLGNMWVGSNGKGICIYERKTGLFRRCSPAISDRNRTGLFSNGFIRAFGEDSAGNMAIATIGSGVALYNPAEHTYRLFNRENTHLPLDDVSTLLIGKRGIIWAGTPNGGLYRIDSRSGAVASFSEQQGLANAVIYKILEDDAGLIWVSTNKGVSSFDPVRSSFKNYTSRNGLQQSSFYLGAGIKTSAGELFYGGLEGFNYFFPGTIHDNKNVPAVVFTDLKTGGHSVVPGKNAAIAEHISVAGEIRLDYKQNFSVEFAALDYTSAMEDRYMYRLDGFDRNWNDVGSSRTAMFTNLYPGNYTLEVRAKNCNGAWTTETAKIKITVRPPYWLTGYAYALYVLLAALLLWAIRYRGIRKLKARFAIEQERLQMKQMIEQERKEAERLHEFDQLRIKFLTNLSHEFRTPVSLIMGPVENLQEQETDSYKQGQLTMVKRNAKRLLNLVNQLLDFRKLEDHEQKLNCSEGDIVAFIGETAESFRDIAERKHIHFTFNTECREFNASFDRDKIERMLFNLLSNAFKFTSHDGKVSLAIKHAGPSNGLTIVISDTGIGMTAAEREKIFDRFFQGEIPAGLINQGSGIGLSITREFVRLHGGTIQVQSTPGKGSAFTIWLPLEQIPAPSAGTAVYDPIPEVELLSAEPKPANGTGPGMLTVLLIEDNEDFRCYLKGKLQSEYKVIEASDGKEGWQKAISRHPDVIVSDISMPNMDGITLSRKIKSDRRVSHIPIILLTALTEDAYQLKGLETGASDYLTKPFRFEILNIKIRNLVQLNDQLKKTYTRRLNIETPAAVVQSEDEKLILTATQFIESNLDSQNLSVEELSRHVCMSHTSLYRKIVDLTGETPVEFIRSIKLKKAAELLERSDMKIAEIGYAVGFTTPNYFTRAFKAKFNLSPSEYVFLKRKQAS